MKYAVAALILLAIGACSPKPGYFELPLVQSDPFSKPELFDDSGVGMPGVRRYQYEWPVRRDQRKYRYQTA